MTRQNNRRRPHHHHLFVYYSQRDSPFEMLPSLCTILILERAELWKKKKKRFFPTYLFIYLFLFFWSFLTLWSIRRRTEERVDTQLSVIFGHFDNNFVFFSVSIFTAHSLDGRAVLVKIKTTFFFYLGKKEGKKRREKQVQQRDNSHLIYD